MIKFALPLALAILTSTGCDQLAGKLGLENPGLKESRNDAEGKAVGSACRHSGRAIEDCYAIYSWLPKASIYAGWREMDEYMRENKLDTIVPQLPPPEPPRSARAKAKAAAQAAAAAENGGSAPAAVESSGNTQAAPAAANPPAAAGKQ